jgi:hypothetical protein
MNVVYHDLAKDIEDITEEINKLSDASNEIYVCNENNIK